ncbi:hypothetical protein, variant 2 [Verruconis gallopava]|uniref:Uncharacterized protein n=1 Tax=Verruconis gallopava TaxID=253628 RepID=A0A0D2BAT7_9PEZI|nr:hypothetical protein, variant 2 [Verruconis gallopava]KIW08419.1 hypothetical protein, variant 2 [Verruconis gallopava]
MSTSVRRSSRATKPSTKYAVDPFEQYKDLLVHSSDDSCAPSEQAEGRDELSSDTEFDAEQAAKEVLEAGMDMDEDSDEQDDNFEMNQGSEDDDDEVEVLESARTMSHRRSNGRETSKFQSSALPKGRSASMKKSTSKRKAEGGTSDVLPIFDPMGNTGAKGRNVHYTRGIPEALHSQGRESRLLYAIGPGTEDLVAHIQVRERWLNDETVPYRQERKGRSGGGLGYSPWYPEEKRNKEAEVELRWYYDEGGKEIFERMQETRKVDMSYAPNNYAPSDDIIAGPINQQELYPGPKLFEQWNLGEAYRDISSAGEHQSWIINAGARIQSLEWCPNKAGTSQYLAVSTSQSPQDVQIPEGVSAPAYTPQAGRQQCLQIWEIFAEGDKDSAANKIDYSRKPVLRQIISTDWGVLKKMRWCPTPDRTNMQEKRLGLLGCIFTDGRIRVIDLTNPRREDGEVEYVHIITAAFESKPPETICTCLTWLSSRNIAAGTADGCVAIWTLPDVLRRTSSMKSRESRPWFYQRLHQSYIHSLTSGYPSRPHLLITYSFDGLVRATDIRSPTYDTVVSQRSRIAQGPVIWHDLTQSALNIDDNFTLKSYGHRLFHKAVSIARLTAFGADVSTSCLHASVLVGCVDGTVWVTNPIRRLRDHKHKPLVQCVLKHEWRRALTRHNSASGGSHDLNTLKSNQNNAEDTEHPEHGAREQDECHEGLCEFCHRV